MVVYAEAAPSSAAVPSRSTASVSHPPLPPQVPPSAASWSRYWATGALHSFSNAFEHNYGDEIRQFWTGFFTDLPEDARILDIGTGNGSIAFLARDTGESMGRRYRVEAIDAAEIRPEAAAAAHGIEPGDIVFRGSTPCEKTGYEDASIDAVSSQFAIEYCDPDQAVAELARIVRAGGRTGFVMHHAASAAVAITEAELAVFATLQADMPLIPSAQALLRDLERVATTKQLAEALFDPGLVGPRRDIEAMLENAMRYAREEAAAGFVAGVATQVARTLNDVPRIGPVAAAERLDVLGEEMSAHRTRLEAVLAAGMTADAMRGFRARLSAAGFDPAEPSELSRDGKLIGWALQAGRAG